MKPRRWPYAVAFVPVFLLLALLLPWRETDFALFGLLPRAGSVHLDEPRIALVDVEHSLDETQYRPRLAQALQLLAQAPGGPPLVVVVDVHLQDKQPGLEEVVAAVQALQQRRCLVFGVVDVLVPNQNKLLDRNYLSRHARQIYIALLDGFGHTLIQRSGKTAFYEAYLTLPGGEVRPSLPTLVAEHKSLAGLHPDALRGMQVLDVGNDAELLARTHVLEQNRLRPAPGAPADLAGKIVIVGSPRSDHGDSAGHAGPHLLAWALNAQLRNPRNPGVAALLHTPWLLVSLVLLFALLSAHLTHHAARRWQVLRGGSSVWTPLVGVATAGIGLVGLTAFALLMGHVYAQWSLVLISATLASVLTWCYARADRAWAQREWAGQQPKPCDVFISYSHTAPGSGGWVDKHVYDTLAPLRRPDGAALKIFLDRYDIRVGQAWPRRLAEAINQSKVFIAVYAGDYFDKAICLAEIEHALGERVRVRASGQDFILVVKHSEPRQVPDAYRDLQFISPTAPGFAASLAQAVLKQVALRMALDAAPDLPPASAGSSAHPAKPTA